MQNNKPQANIKKSNSGEWQALFEQPIVVPEELSGANGTYRAKTDCRIAANNDLDAISSWLALKQANPKTFIAYKKELERLLFWAMVERHKALSSLSTEDCAAYIVFLQGLTSEHRQWVADAPPRKTHATWKPFYCRKKKEDEVMPVLSAKSINYAKTVISGCFDWLVRQNYLKFNNFEDIATLKLSAATPQINQRSFTHKQMQKVFAYAQAQFNNATSMQQRSRTRRTLFILKFAFSTGLRIHELAAARYGDIERLDDAETVHYFIRVVGKNSKLRKTSLPETLLVEMRDYLRFQNVAVHFEAMPAQALLIPAIRNQSRQNPLTPAAIHQMLSAFFRQMASDLSKETDADPRFIQKLTQASAHWLRHSYGSFLANDQQVPLTYIRDELGHANISTTSLYLNTDEKNRQKAISNAFAMQLIPDDSGQTENY